MDEQKPTAAEPINLSAPPEPDPQVPFQEVGRPKGAGSNSIYLMTAAIFFTLGFLAAGLMGVNLLGDDYRADPTLVVEGVRGTLIALTPTPTPTATAVPIRLSYSEQDYIWGSADAPITLVEFSDYRCPYCNVFATNILKPLLSYYDGTIKFVYRDYPIFGEESFQAAHAARCVADQDEVAFWDYHDALFLSQASETPITLEAQVLREMAESVGVEGERFTACFIDERVRQEIVQNVREAQNLLVSGGGTTVGTPTFLLNGRRIEGTQPLSRFIELINRELLELGIEPPQS